MKDKQETQLEIMMRVNELLHEMDEIERTQGSSAINFTLVGKNLCGAIELFTEAGMTEAAIELTLMLKELCDNKIKLLKEERDASSHEG